MNLITMPAMMTPAEVKRSPSTWSQALLMFRSLCPPFNNLAMTMFPIRPPTATESIMFEFISGGEKIRLYVSTKMKNGDDHEGRAVDEGGQYADPLISVGGAVV